MHAVWAPSGRPPEPDPVEDADQHGVEIGIGLVSRWPMPRRRRCTTCRIRSAVGPPPRALAATLEHPAGPLHVIVGCTEWEPEYAADHRAQCAGARRPRHRSAVER
jgi:hypothetical protein